MKELKKEQQEVIDKLITLFTENNEKVLTTDCSVIDSLFNDVNEKYQEYNDAVDDLVSWNESMRAQFEDSITSVHTRLDIMFDPYPFVSINVNRYDEGDSAHIRLRTVKGSEHYSFSIKIINRWNYVTLSDLYPTQYKRYERIQSYLISIKYNDADIDITDFENNEKFIILCKQLFAFHLSK
jgi:hypothetical protein